MSLDSEWFFGGFVITYNRPLDLAKTVRLIFEQSISPSQLWIIDNSDNDATYSWFLGVKDSRLKYFKMGYNAGPAGAAARGLQICGQEGMDWIYWGDDNDPPFKEDCFERLLAIRNENPFTGALGVVGHFFDRNKGEIKRIQTRLLERKKILEVDTIAGGQCLLVSGDAARVGITPDPNLFFGFEELDFCLKLKRRGFSLVVDCGLFLECRAFYNKLEYKRPIYQEKKNLSREYYSTRNLLIIADTLTMSPMKKRILIKSLGKMIWGFRYGISYGSKNFYLIGMALFDYFTGKKGFKIPLTSQK